MHTARAVALLILFLAALPASAGLQRSRTITAEEAARLASTYTLVHVAGCGGMEAPIARADHWEVPLRVGVVGARAGAVRIDRRTGAVSYRWRGKAYPTRSAKQLAEEERRLMSRAPKA